VTVHNLGSVDSPSTSIALQDGAGTTLATSAVPAIKAPLDLIAKTTQVIIPALQRASLGGCQIVIDPEKHLKEITTCNNVVLLSSRRNS
jgi:hypothetical protein